MNISMKIKFYDTCSLLLAVDNLFEDPEVSIMVSSITFQELENIKTAYNKDPDIKYAARKLLHLLDENTKNFSLWIFDETMLEPIKSHHFEITPDTKILATAINAKEHYPDLVFVSNDFALRGIAQTYFFEGEIESVDEDEAYSYTGYEEIHLSNDEMAEFYSNRSENLFNLKRGQYANIYDEFDNVVDTIVWTGEDNEHVSFKSFPSKWFGNVKPMKDDVYQVMAADSFLRNKITMIKGPAGAGKTYLSLGYLMHLLEKGKIDKIIVFCNTVATQDAAKLGFYPGSRDEKLLDSQIGNLLSSKLGGKIAVEQMIEDESLVLLPLSDIRGYDTTGMHAGIYISEAQNLNVNLMKLALQRIGEDSICIIDGDDKAQVDSVAFAGSNNGMKRASRVYRGTDVYGEVELKNIHRSKIARIAELM